MARNSMWFTHDFYSRNDPKIQKLNRMMGMEGIGIFWCIVEMMHEQDGYLMLTDCDDYAFALHTDSERIKSVLNDFGLFKQNETHFWSEAAILRIGERKEKSKKTSAAADAKWKSQREKAENDASAMQMHNIRTADAMLLHNSTVQESTVQERTKEEKIGGGEHAAIAAPPQKNSNSLEKVASDEKTFYNTLSEFVPEYGKEMIREFYDYWREPTKSGKKMKFQIEPTWDTSLRLQSWRRKGDKWGITKQIEKIDSPIKIVKDGATLLAETEIRQRENAKKYLVNDVPAKD